MATGDARSFVYGSAPAGAAVHVTISSEVPTKPFERTYDAVAITDGSWAVQIDGTYASDPQGRHGPHYGPCGNDLAMMS